MQFSLILHQERDHAIVDWGTTPPMMDGRGIVTSIYDAEFASGFILLSELKRLQVPLPVEVFYRRGELSSEQIEILENIGLDLKVRVLEDEVHGFAIKPFSILRSRFAEVLWIDCDNVPIRNPAFLFDDPEYLSKGSLFWRDVSGVDRSLRWHPGSPVWDAFGVPYNDGEEFETGQLLIDKRKCWQELGLTIHYNREAETYYQFVHGDKDTFRFAWLVTHIRRGGQAHGGNYLSSPNVPYGFMPFGPFHVGEPNPWNKWGGGSVMQQRDRMGQPLFNHRSIDKFTLRPRPSGLHRESEESWRTYGPSEEHFYLEHLAKLRWLWQAVSLKKAEALSTSPSRPVLSSPRVPSSSARGLQTVWLPPVL